MMAQGGAWDVFLRDFYYDYEAPDFTEAADVLQGSGKVDFSLDEIINEVVWEALYDSANQPAARGTQNEPGSAAAYGTRGASLQLHWAGTAATAADVAARRIVLCARPLRKAYLAAGLRGLTVSLGENIRLTLENMQRQYCELRRRDFNGQQFTGQLECLDLAHLVGDGFFLAAERQRSADVAYNLPADDPRNAAVCGAIDDSAVFGAGGLTSGVGTDEVSASSGDFAAYAVKVGDLLKLDEGADRGYYEIYETGLAVGDPVSSGATLTVKNAFTGAAVSFAGATAAAWWICRSWRTANAEQQRAGHLVRGGRISAFADAGGGQVEVTSAAHGLAEGQAVKLWGSANYNGEFTATNIAANTFEITAAWKGDDAAGTWAATEYTVGAADAKRLL